MTAEQRAWLRAEIDRRVRERVRRSADRTYGPGRAHKIAKRTPGDWMPSGVIPTTAGVPRRRGW